jgi:hypothetical protein
MACTMAFLYHREDYENMQADIGKKRNKIKSSSKGEGEENKTELNFAKHSNPARFVPFRKQDSIMLLHL